MTRIFKERDMVSLKLYFWKRMYTQTLPYKCINWYSYIPHFLYIPLCNGFTSDAHFWYAGIFYRKSSLIAFEIVTSQKYLKVPKQCGNMLRTESYNFFIRGCTKRNTLNKVTLEGKQSKNQTAWVSFQLCFDKNVLYVPGYLHVN